MSQSSAMKMELRWYQNWQRFLNGTWRLYERRKIFIAMARSKAHNKGFKHLWIRNWRFTNRYVGEYPCKSSEVLRSLFFDKRGYYEPGRFLWNGYGRASSLEFGRGRDRPYGTGRVVYSQLRPARPHHRTGHTTDSVWIVICQRCAKPSLLTFETS